MARVGTALTSGSTASMRAATASMRVWGLTSSRLSRATTSRAHACASAGSASPSEGACKGRNSTGARGRPATAGNPWIPATSCPGAGSTAT